MKQTPNLTQKVKDLVYLLQHPKRLSLRRRNEPEVDREEVRKNMRLRWKDPGFCSIQFQKPPILKPTMLDQWQIQRINMATRSFKTAKQSKPYRFDQKSRQFPKLRDELYPVKFQRYLKQIQSENEDLLFKDKRTKTMKTEGRYPSQMLEQQQTLGRTFKPVSTNTSYFGFSPSSNDPKRKLTTPHLKTTNA